MTLAQRALLRAVSITLAMVVAWFMRIIFWEMGPEFRGVMMGAFGSSAMLMAEYFGEHLLDKRP